MSEHNISAAGQDVSGPGAAEASTVEVSLHDAILVLVSSDYDKNPLPGRRDAIARMRKSVHTALDAQMAAPTPPATAPRGAAGAVSVEEVVEIWEPSETLADVIATDVCARMRNSLLHDEESQLELHGVVQEAVAQAVEDARIAAPQAKDGVREASAKRWSIVTVGRESGGSPEVRVRFHKGEDALAFHVALARLSNLPANPEKPGQEALAPLHLPWRVEVLPCMDAPNAPSKFADVYSISEPLYRPFHRAERMLIEPIVAILNSLVGSPAPQHDGKPEVGA